MITRSFQRASNLDPIDEKMCKTFFQSGLMPALHHQIADSQNTFQQLRRVVNDISHFIDPDDCVDFLSDVQSDKVFLIISGAVGQLVVPLIHSMAHVDAILIFCRDKRRHEEWAQAWSKIKGVFTHVDSICEALQLVVKQCNQDSIAISFSELGGVGESGVNLNQLDPSFMYTQLLKNALLGMRHDRKAVEDLVRYCQDKYAGNTHELTLVREFGLGYRPEKAVWWYTRECFTYHMLNRALRHLEADIIVNMGFFIHDLHRQIERMHAKQISEYRGEPFFVYRGQRLSFTDFEKLQRTQGGLISFNSFLSTSQDKSVSLRFTQGALTNSDTVRVLFIMMVNPKVTLTPFARIQEQSAVRNEAEILFTMHTVFRISRITDIDGRGRLFEIELTQTVDDDKQLRILTERFDADVKRFTGWDRVGRLLIQVGNLEKAEDLYMTLLSQPLNEMQKALYNDQLGQIKNKQGRYEEALRFYGMSLNARQKTLPANHLLLATSFSNIGLVYANVGEYSKALSFDEKALDIYRKTLPTNHPLLATSYHNIGNLCNQMGEYSKAVSFYGKTLDIEEKILPDNHPDLAMSYNNIGFLYCNLGEYSEALSFHKKALDIWQKTLPTSHPLIAMSYNNIGIAHKNMGEYSKALFSHETALHICRQSLSANDPDLALSYNNIATVCACLGDYSKALSFYEEALDIWQRTLPGNHPHLRMIRESIEAVYKKL